MGRRGIVTGRPTGRAQFVARARDGRNPSRWQADCRRCPGRRWSIRSRAVIPTSPLRCTRERPSLKARGGADLRLDGPDQYRQARRCRMLNDLWPFSVQRSDRDKRRDGSTHPDRNAQFVAHQCDRAPLPAASATVSSRVVYARRSGIGQQLQEWRARMAAEGHQFAECGALPGVSRPTRAGRPFLTVKLFHGLAVIEAWVSVGHDHDMPAWSKPYASIRHWWRQLGRRCYDDGQFPIDNPLITADRRRSSNGYRLFARAEAWN